MRQLRNLSASVAAIALAMLPLDPAAAGLAIAKPGYDWAMLDAYLATRPEAVEGGALIVYHKGEIVYRKNFGLWSGTDLEDISRPVASVSKSHAAVIALMADEDPALNFSIDDDLATHYPAVVGFNPSYSGMTMRQLLAMTAGIAGLSPVNSCLGDDSLGFDQCIEQGILLDGAGTARPLYRNSAPGTFHVYGGAPWNVMAKGVQTAFNRGHRVSHDWGQIADHYLFRPCGWTATRYGQTRNFWVGGGVRTNLDEGGELAQLLLSGSCTNGRSLRTPVIGLTSLETMRRDQLSGATIGASAYGKLGGGREARRYGHGLFHNNAGPLAAPGRGTLFIGPGATGSHLFLDTARGYAGFLYLAEGPFVGFPRGTRIFETILPMIEAQVDAND